MQLFLLPMQICQHYRRVFAKLPNDLPASSARRRELLGVGNDYQSGKVSLAFRERFPDRYPLGANGQAVARATECKELASLSRIIPLIRSILTRL